MEKGDEGDEKQAKKHSWKNYEKGSHCTAPKTTHIVMGTLTCKLRSVLF